MISKKIKKVNSVSDQREIFKDLELMGVTDIAKEWGWRKQRVSTYAERGILPQPIGEIGGRPVWTRKQLENVKK